MKHLIDIQELDKVILRNAFSKHIGEEEVNKMDFTGKLVDVTNFPILLSVTAELYGIEKLECSEMLDTRTNQMETIYHLPGKFDQTGAVEHDEPEMVMYEVAEIIPVEDEDIAYECDDTSSV